MSRDLTSAVIVAGGSSSRFGSDKIFADLCGRPVIVHSLLTFERCAAVDEIIAVVRENKIDETKSLAVKHNISKLTAVVPGGYTRSESVSNGIYACSKKALLVAIHDGARPLITTEMITDAINKASRYGAAIPVVNINSTVKRVKHGYVTETPSREELREAQTPQVFDIDLMKAALIKASKATDDSSLLEALGVTVYTTPGLYRNIKLTTREDLIIAEALYNASSKTNDIYD